MIDSYLSITEPTTGFYKEKGSKFLAFAFPVQDEEDIERCFEEVRKAESKARHHCYAWRLGTDGNAYRANDDGEPSGTAGRPILGQIDSFELSHVLIIVVRYFGGVKLGTSGLINAYREAAKAALDIAETEVCIIEQQYEIRFDYGLMSPVMQALKADDWTIIKQDFGTEASIRIGKRASEAAEALLRLKAHISGKYLSEIDEETEVEGFIIIE